MRALDFYSQWTGIVQPIKVFNLVAVPGKKGSMENWGLLMFDEDRFLLHTVCSCFSTIAASHGLFLSLYVSSSTRFVPVSLRLLLHTACSHNSCFAHREGLAHRILQGRRICDSSGPGERVKTSARIRPLTF